jgi:hypothetical protein
MRAAILCRGPSLPLTYVADGNYPLIIAVNCAINYYEAHYLVAGDPSTFNYVTGRPTIGCVYRSGLAQDGEQMPNIAHKSWEVDWIDAEPWTKSTSFSMEMAMIFAHREGFFDMDIYGADLRPCNPDERSIASEGRQVIECPERFNDEIKRFNDLKTALGGDIRRILPA